MIVYSISIIVDLKLVERFEDFMRDTHIPDLLKTGCFESAEFDKISKGKYRATYFAKTQEDLERYLKFEAADLRKDFLSNFPDGVDIKREIGEV